MKSSLQSLRFRLIQALNEPFRDVALGIAVHVYRKSAEETHGLGSVKDPFTSAGAAPGYESELLACSVLVFIILI